MPKVPSFTGKTYTSKPSAPGGRTFHSVSAAPATPKPAVAKPQTPVTGATLYVLNCSSTTGTGTAADPYCSVQQAVDAAVPGDTISVQTDGQYAAVTVRTSDLTFVSTGSTEAYLSYGITLSGVSDITISGFRIAPPDVNSPAVLISGSSDVTLNSDDITSYYGAPVGSVAIDGSSSAITISRSALYAQSWSGGGVGIDIAAGASNITVASDVFASLGGADIQSQGVQGLDVVGNTIERSCGSAVSVAGSSTAVSIENNYFEDTPLGKISAGQAECVGLKEAWAPDVTVDSDSAAATTTDYNDFNLPSADGTVPYSWAGDNYPLLASFQEDTKQGGHDLTDTVQPGVVGFDIEGNLLIPIVPGYHSTALKSANTSAPGALSTDYYGASPYDERGAVAIVNHTVANLTVTDDSMTGVTAQAGGSTAASGLDDSIASYTFTWGDGTSTTTTTAAYASHTYASRGTYTVGVTVTDQYGFTATTSLQASTAPNDHMVAQETLTAVDALSVYADASQSSGDDGISTYSFDWGDGMVSPGGASTAVHTYAQPGTYTVTITISDKNSDSATTSTQVTTSGSDYTAFGPTRLLDTRIGTGAPESQVNANGKVRLQIAGAGKSGSSGKSIPADVTAVVLNITLTDTHGAGFITAYPDDDATVPPASNVNYHAGQTVANLAIVPVGADGAIYLTNSGATAGPLDLIADVTGYFTPTAAGGYTSLTPDRLVDTRIGTGVREGQVQQGGTITVKIEGADGNVVPTVGVTAVALNVTVTDTGGSGFLTAYPTGESEPTASNVNYDAGQTIANSVVVPVGPDGDIQITNSGATAKGTDIIVDVVGYYGPTSDSAYYPTGPTRLVDTRDSEFKPIPNNWYFALPLAVDGDGDDVPIITGAVVNATVTDTQGNGFLAVSPDPNDYDAYVNNTATPPTPPNSSSLNWVRGETVPNLVQAATGTTGMVDFWNLGAAGGDTDLIVDVFGYYMDA